MDKKSEKRKKKMVKMVKMVKMDLSGVRKPASDLDRLRKLTDRKIQNAIKKDSDAAPLLMDWPEDAEVILPKQKVAISLRVDPEVLEFYKHQEIGHLSLMNAVLKAYMQSQLHHDRYHR